MSQYWLRLVEPLRFSTSTFRQCWLVSFWSGTPGSEWRGRREVRPQYSTLHLQIRVNSGDVCPGAETFLETETEPTAQRASPNLWGISATFHLFDGHFREKGVPRFPHRLPCFQGRGLEVADSTPSCTKSPPQARDVFLALMQVVSSLASPNGFVFVSLCTKQTKGAAPANKKTSLHDLR